MAIERYKAIYRAPRRIPYPIRLHLPPLATQRALQSLRHTLPIHRRRQPVPACLHQLDPLGLIAQGDAGNAVEEGLFLNAARVGSDEGGKLFQLHHGQIADGLDQVHGFCQRVQPPGLLQHGARARVQGPDHGQGFCGSNKRVDDGRQALGVVGVFGSVDGGQHVGFFP